MAKNQNSRIKIDKTQVIVAFISATALIIAAYWQFVWKPSQQSVTPTPVIQQVEYIGRVLDDIPYQKQIPVYFVVHVEHYEK